MFGITSWRNIIPYYTLDGAVTEINAECYFALEAAAMMRAVVGENDTVARFADEATHLREAIRSRSSTPIRRRSCSTTIRTNYQDNFTADEVFPVLFGVPTRECRSDSQAAFRSPIS